MQNKPIIKINNVNYTYKLTQKTNSKAVNNLSLEINEGEFITIIGHNGSGKSTLARLMNGILQPQEGDIFVLDYNTKEDKDIYNVRKNVGMVFQNPDNQMVATIVEDDIAFGPENIGIEREEICTRIEWALKSVDMMEYRYKTTQKMSGGQKQRIAIASVLAMKPKVIIFDESTAMLDPRGRKEVLKTIKKLNKEENITIILITHYMDETIDSDRVIVMNKGSIILQGKPKEVFKEKKILESINLKFPIYTEIANSLTEKGLNVGNDILTKEELVDKICDLILIEKK